MLVLSYGPQKADKLPVDPEHPVFSSRVWLVASTCRRSSIDKLDLPCHVQDDHGMHRYASRTVKWSCLDLWTALEPNG